jgi:hypothetical protein
MGKRALDAAPASGEAQTPAASGRPGEKKAPSGSLALGGANASAERRGSWEPNTRSAAAWRKFFAPAANFRSSAGAAQSLALE